MPSRFGRIRSSLSRILLFGLFSAAPLLTFAQRSVSFQITVQEPRPGFVKQVIVDLECQGAGCKGSAQTLTLNRSGQVFSGTYNLPNDLVDVLLAPYVRFVVDNPTLPNVGWHSPNRDAMKFTDPASPTYRSYVNAWSVDFRELTVRARYWDGQDWVHAEPNVLIRGTMPAANRVVPAASIREKQFVQGSATIALPFGDHFLSAAPPIEVEGRLDFTMPDPDGTTVTTRLIQTERASPQFGTANEVRVDFMTLAWLEPIRRAMERDLNYAGVSEAHDIAQVEFFFDPNQNGAEWRQERLKRDVWYETTKIALGPTFDCKAADGGDTLLHEWTHETAYRAGWRSGGTSPNGKPCPTAHSFGQLCPCEWMGWDEAVNHFAGSTLLGRALTGTSGLRVTGGVSWLDTDADVRRGIALGLLPQCVQRFNRENPGSWTEDVVAGSLVELYRAEGIDTEGQPLDALRAFVTDWRGFAGQYGQTDRTARNFFLFKRAHVNSPVPRVDAHVVDQMGLWYLITTRQDVQALGPIEQLVPLRLEATAPRVQAGAQATFRASARAFFRLVGQYRGYGGSSIRVRLTENGKPIGKEAHFSADTTNPDFNFAAQLANAWPNDTDKPVEHRVRAEVWGNFIDGHTDELLGRSDEVAVIVEGKTRTTGTPQPPGALTLTVKPEVAATEIFDAKVDVPAEMLGKTAEWGWLCGGKVACQVISDKPQGQEGPSVQVQYSNPDDGQPNPVALYVTLRDASGKDLGSARKDLILLKPVSFQGTAQDVWEAKQYPQGMNLKRKPLERTRPNGYKASATANLDLKWCKDFCPKTPQELEQKVDQDCGGLGRTEKKPLTIGNFKGFVMETKGVSTRAFVNAYMTSQAECGASGRGFLMYGRVVLEVTYTVSGGGVDDQDVPYLRAQGEAAWSEVHSILSGLTIVPDGKITLTPYTGPKPTDAQPTVRLVLTPDRTKLRAGEVVEVSAVVENAKPEDNPIAFTWDGDHEGSGGTVRFHALKPGKFTLSVTAGGARSPIGTASKEFEVEALTAVIEKRSPPGETIPFGTDATFAAKVLSGGQPATGAFTFRWEPHPDVIWHPDEGTPAQSTASFPRPGRVRVWVSVLEPSSGGALLTAAEAEFIELTVGLPKFGIAFEPPSAFVGQPTRARIVLDGQIPQDRIEFNWELTNNGKPQTSTQGVREVAFIPMDRNRITVVARARVPHYGDDLGSATASFEAQACAVTIRVLGPAGPPPPGAELVNRPGALAVGQMIGLAAEISPQPTGPVTFVWESDAAFENGRQAGREIHLAAQRSGSLGVVVRAKDAEGHELGVGTTTVQVAISQSDIDAAKVKKGMDDNIAKARAMMAAARYEEAVAAVLQVAAIDSDYARPVRNEVCDALKKLGSDALTRRDFTAAERLYDLALQIYATDGEAQQGKIRAANGRRDWANLQAQATEAEALIAQGRLPSAEPKIDSIKVLERNLPPPTSPQAQAAIQHYEQALAGYRAMIADAKAKQRDYFARKEWGTALAMFQGLARRELFKEDEVWVRENLDVIPRLQAEDAQKGARAEQLKGEGAALEKQGRFQDALGKYRESLGVLPDPALDAHVRDLESRLGRALDLGREGSACEQRNDIGCALAKYEEAQGVLPSPQIAERIQQLKARLQQEQAQEQEKKLRAKQLFEEGKACESRNELPCAVSRYEEALGIVPDDQLADHVRQLKDRMAQQQDEENRRKSRAAQLFSEGQSCENRGDLACAVGKYEEALTILPNAQLAQHVQDLKARLQAAEQDDQRKLRAKQLFEEGQACESRGDLPCAISKYEAAVAIIPNAQISERIRQLRAQLSQGKTDSGAANSTGPSKLLSTGNISTVRNGPTAPTTFSLNGPARLAKIKNYHWNDGRGAPPGRIGVRRSDGATYGPWPATGAPGQGGVANANWKVAPGVDLPPGNYTVLDSDPATWSCNDSSGGRGMSEISLVPLEGTSGDFAELVPTGKQGTPQPQPQPQPKPQPSPTPQPTGHFSSSGDITGTWSVMGSYDIRFSASGNSYAATLLTVSAGMAEIHFQAGETVIRLTRVSDHIYRGQYLQKESNGTPSWTPCTMGVDGNDLYMGDGVTESDPTQGMSYARRK